MASVNGESAQVRRIAILVTSLDAAAGRQLLLAMPSQLARDVRKAMAALTSVDPDERRRVLAEFRHQALSSSEAYDKVQTSLPAANSPAPQPSFHTELQNAHAAAAIASPAGAGAVNLADDSPSSTGTRHSGEEVSSENSRTWQRFDVPTLTDLLRGERATVIAVVLSQLQPRQAVGLLEQLPRQQHRSVIANLSRLGDIDPEAMQAIDEHLASRIADYGHRRASETESIGRMQDLLSAASPELRGHWQDIIAETDRQLADRLGIVALAPGSNKTPAGMRTTSQAATSERPSAPNNLLELLASNVVTTADTPFVPSNEMLSDEEPDVLPFHAPARTSKPPLSTAAPGAITKLEQILEMPPQEIAQVLSAADGEVVLLALAGATPAFMQRFTNLLEKPDARTLHARLRKLGAINLQDVDEAQRRLCELATRVSRESLGHRRASFAVSAAA